MELSLADSHRLFAGVAGGSGHLDLRLTLVQNLPESLDTYAFVFISGLLLGRLPGKSFYLGWEIFVAWRA
jgi:hypothetical protein